MGVGALLAGSAVANAMPPVILRKPRRIVLSPRDLDTLVRTLWGEARGCDKLCQYAVAHTIFNRVRSTAPMFVKDISVAKACRRIGQFSCWRLLKVALLSKSDPEYRKLETRCVDAVWCYNEGRDYSCGATHYDNVGDPHHVEWIKHARHTTRLDRINFYHLV